MKRMLMMRLCLYQKSHSSCSTDPSGFDLAFHVDDEDRRLTETENTDGGEQLNSDTRPLGRRSFIKGLGLVSAGTVASGLALTQDAVGEVNGAELELALTAVGGWVDLVDGRQAYQFSFSDDVAGLAPRYPSPTILVQADQTITLGVTNSLATRCSFAIAGTSLHWDIEPGQTVSAQFTAPAPGTYLYHDALNSGVNRVMGLYGAMIVMPSGVTDRAFAGGPTFARQFKWLLGNIDSRWSDAVEDNGDDHVTELGTPQGLASFTPDYFLINAASFPDTHNQDTDLSGGIGNPALVRMINAGMAVHSMHFHGNHVDVCSINGTNFPTNRKHKDSVTMFPLDTRDVLLPFEVPPDIPPGEFADGFDPAGDPQHYPMHCHTELSQTAGGGSYPHGMHCGITIGQEPAIESDLTRAVARQEFGLVEPSTSSARHRSHHGTE